jgi:uncharacterized Tic20 family protein
MSGFAGLCCIGSVCLLGGTIFWVRRMTFSKDSSGLQADSFNLKMVFGHIALLLAQISIVIINVVPSTNAFIDASIQYVISTTLDTIVCCLICSLISESDFLSCFK